MEKYIQTLRTFISGHQKDIRIAVPIIIIAGVLIGLVVFSTLKNMPNIVYQPVKACDLFTPTEATDLLGQKVNSVDTKEPIITKDTATSKCSYTDLNQEMDKMIVAAVAVQSGINDKGVAENKINFAAKKPTIGTEDVKGLGESAYFNHANGQLNILDGKKWMILSYGVGSTPQENTIDKATEFAKKVLN